MTHPAIRFVCRKTGLASGGIAHYEQAVILNVILGFFACLSFALLLWQWLAARRFPLHQRSADLQIGSTDRNATNEPNRSASLPPVTLLKPLKGCDAETEKCLRSWFAQKYPEPIQILFGVASANDPVCEIVRKLLSEFPQSDAQLIVCENLTGTNAKVSKLAQLTNLAKHDALVISDADVRVPEDFLANVVLSLASDASRPGSAGFQPASCSRRVVGVDGEMSRQIGLVNCFYRLANPTTFAMQWEAVAINADFWSQVLQSKALKPLDFALGAVMVTHRKYLDEIGGFESLKDCLADDYQLGHRIAKKGHRIELCPVVVECWHSPQTWREVWKHQLRWARTIRVCQPAPYFFSILSNPTLWPIVWLVAAPDPVSAGFCGAMIFIRALITENLQHRMVQRPCGTAPLLAPLKDLLQAAIWLCAFIGNTIEWRGQKFTLKPDGSLVRKQSGV